MFWIRVKLMRRLSLATLLGLGLPAFAQQGIQFSTPVDDDDAAKPPESTTTLTHKAPSSFNAPKPLFGGGPQASFDRLPQAPVSRNDNPKWRRTQEDQQNWALLTPEQILGIPTPESILGITDRSDDKLTPDERFLKRQDQKLESTATNAWHQDIWGARKGLWSEPMSGANESPFARSADRVVSGLSDVDRSSMQLSGQDPSSGWAQSQRLSTWSSPFANPPPLSKPTPGQVENLERFRALLAPADKKTAGPGQPLQTPSFTAQPDYNPNGASVKAMVSGMVKPTGLTPLNGIFGLPPIPAKRAPLVKPPPWLSEPTALSTPTLRTF